MYPAKSSESSKSSSVHAHSLVILVIYRGSADSLHRIKERTKKTTSKLGRFVNVAQGDRPTCSRLAALLVRHLAARHHRSRHQLAMCTERPQLLGAQYGRCCVPPISTHLPDTMCAPHAGVVFRVRTCTLTTSRLQLDRACDLAKHCREVKVVPLHLLTTPHPKWTCSAIRGNVPPHRKWTCRVEGGKGMELAARHQRSRHQLAMCTKRATVAVSTVWQVLRAAHQHASAR